MENLKSNDTNTSQTDVSRSQNSLPSAVPTDSELKFGLLMNRVLGGTSNRRPSDKSANAVQIDIMLSQANNLARMNDQYHETYVVKGTKALYDLLKGIYSYTLQIDQSPLRDEVLQTMRDRMLKEHEIKTQANTNWITTVIRFILPKDRQTAFNYSKVLQVAHEENLSPDELPSYIKERGGISKITATEEQAASTKASKEVKEKKVKLLKKVLLANAKATHLNAEIPESEYLDAVDDGKEKGTFEYAICYKVEGQTRILKFVHVSEKLENEILASMAAVAVDDVDSMTAKLDVLRAKLGITNGWGMEPGDKGFALPGVPVVNQASLLESASVSSN